MFVTAEREDSRLQKMKQTTSVGVGPATLTMPSGSAQVLGVVRRQTVGTIMGAALSTAYADEQYAPTPDNQQANQPAPNTGANAGAQVNPAPFGANSDRGNPQQSGQPDRDGDHHGMTRDRRDTGRDQADFRRDRQDLQQDRAPCRPAGHSCGSTRPA